MNTTVTATATGLKINEPSVYITKKDGTRSKIDGSFGAIVAMLVKYGVDATPLEMGFGTVTLPTGEVLSPAHW